MNLDRESVWEDPLWEAYRFDNEELSITKSIVARGQFGASYVLGRIHPNRSISSKINKMTMMKSCAENEAGKCYNGLKAEMNILYDLCHRYVVQLIGYCLVENPDVCKLVLVFEYCSNGNLIKILQKGRPYFDCGAYCPTKAINNEILSPDLSLNFCDWHLLKWATEIARGMEYLAFKGVVHGDIAARNIILSCDWTAKIGNFGIAQRHGRQDISYATKLSKDVLPIAWMAPETIQSFKLSESSDVWSFAVTLWEIYSLGDMPYKAEKIEFDSKFFAYLLQGMRLPRPKHVTENIWNLMVSCWSFQPEDRPKFSKIKTFLDRTFYLVGSNQDASHTRHDSSDSTSSSMGETSPKGKTVSFDLQTHGGFMKKCLDVADNVISKARKLSSAT